MYSRGALVACASHPDRASQAPRLIFPRALPPTTPEGPLAAYACCFPTGLSGFILVGGLATFVFLSRPNRVHLRCGSRVRLPSSASPIAGTHARSATCRTGNLHGELLSVHKISQAYPGVPDQREADSGSSRYSPPPQSPCFHSHSGWSGWLRCLLASFMITGAAISVSN